MSGTFTNKLQTKRIEMPRFIVDLWLDGYDTEEEMVDACEQFIYEQLNFYVLESNYTLSSVKIELIEEENE